MTRLAAAVIELPYGCEVPACTMGAGTAYKRD